MKTPQKMTMDEIRKGIKLAIEESIADKYEAFRESLKKWWLETAYDFSEKHKGEEWYDATHGKRGERNEFLISISSDLRKLVEDVAGDRHRSIVGGLKPNAKKVALDIATAEADEARTHFIQKNTLKLENIIHNKSLYGVDGMEVTPIHVRAGSTFEGSIDLKFSDGMEFIVTNKLVYKRSILGRPFFQYPTTFHNVKIAGQKTRSMVPEDEMLELADPDNIGKRISKEEEIDQEQKQVRRDEREAKRDEKRQKALARHEYEVTLPDGTKEKADPTARELTCAVAMKQSGYNWVVYSSNWYTDRSKAEAAIRKMQREYANQQEYVILPARRLAQPDHVGEVGGEVDVFVMVTGIYRQREGYWTRASDANGNRFLWLDDTKYETGTALEIEGVIEKHDENDKFEKYNRLNGVRVKK